MASGYLSEDALSDAIVLLDRAVSSREVEPAARELCERAGVDPNDDAQLHELLAALSARLTEMTGGRAEAFSTALQAWPADQRFSLPALADVIWPALENLRKASSAPVTAEEASRIVRQHEAPLAAQYLRFSGRGREAWEATRAALVTRLPALYARYAAWASAHESGAIGRLAQTPEGVAVICAALGLVTLRMAVPTPLVCAVFGLVGYAGVAPIVERVQGRFRAAIFEALADEDRAIRELEHARAPIALDEVLAGIRPVVMSAVLAGIEDRDALMEHVEPVLARMRTAALSDGGPGAAYADAVVDVVRTRYIPRLVAIVAGVRAAVEGSLMRRAWREPNAAGLMTMVATIPVSLAAATVTPWGYWDAPLMAALCFVAGRTVSTLLASPRRQLDDLDAAMLAEQRLLAGLHPAPSPS